MKESPPFPERDKSEVGKRIVVLRTVLGLSAKEMCSSVNVEQNTWSQWERGKRMAALDAMARLFDVTGADLNFIFLGRTETMQHELAVKIREALAKQQSAPSNVQPIPIPKRKRKAGASTKGANLKARG